MFLVLVLPLLCRLPPSFHRLAGPFRIFSEFAQIKFKKEGNKTVKRVSLMLLFAAVSIAVANGSASAQMQMNQMDSMNPMVGGAAMLRSRDIVDNAVNSADHTTLVAAVKAAGLVETLKGTGPFTVFAPTNAAFDKLPAGTVGTLVKPENKETLTKILTYHVLAGKFDANQLAGRITKSRRGNLRQSRRHVDGVMSGNDRISRQKAHFASDDGTFFINELFMVYSCAGQTKEREGGKGNSTSSLFPLPFSPFFPPAVATYPFRAYRYPIRRREHALITCAR